MRITGMPGSRLDGKPHPHRPPLRTKPQFFIYSVDVLGEFQNLGIGSSLFQYVVDYTKENDFFECFVITNKANLPACKTYEKAGGKSDYEDEIVYVVKHE